MSQLKYKKATLVSLRSKEEITKETICMQSVILFSNELQTHTRKKYANNEARKTFHAFCTGYKTLSNMKKIKTSQII